MLTIFNQKSFVFAKKYRHLLVRIPNEKKAIKQLTIIDNIVMNLNNY